MFVFAYVETNDGKKEFSILNYPVGVSTPEGEICINPRGIQAHYPCSQRDDEAVHLFYHLFALRHQNSILTFGEAVRASCFDIFLSGYVGDMNRRPQPDPSFLNDHRYLPNNQDGMQVFEEILRLMLRDERGPVDGEWGGSMRGVLEYLREQAWQFGHEVLDARL